MPDAPRQSPPPTRGHSARLRPRRCRRARPVRTRPCPRPRHHPGHRKRRSTPTQSLPSQTRKNSSIPVGQGYLRECCYLDLEN
ncbi:hypothetical protein PVAP13_4NG078519 [Panicum virgatum]|uniref:Uncharacterized protein n=1 Tax=Panicum virgatum TaxID=38727 RepID=A0A8T0TBB7_PANVG|nr:hypothetical protein PVAP13_4NG078519 [Panicum virgatum]